MSDTGAFHEIVILGAGLAGLGCARALPGARVFEAEAQPGGHARSHALAGYSFDEGAHICHSRDQEYLKLIFSSAGQVNHVTASQVMNWKRGRWITYPVQNHLHELPLTERQAALAGFVRAQIERADVAPTNYREWCLNQYGETLTSEYYALYTAKYWRVPMEELGTDWLTGRLLPAQVDRVVAGALGKPEQGQAVFASFHYPAEHGYFTFYRSLYSGLDLQCNARAVEIDPVRRTVSFANGRTEDYGHLVSSLPLPTLVKLVKDVPASVREAASRLRHTRLLCINIVVNRPAVTPMHWFYIYDSEIEAARVSVPSNLGRDRVAASTSAFQVEIFRLPEEPMDIDALTENSVEALCRMMGVGRQEIVAVQPVVVPHAYVISDQDRSAAVQHVLEWAEKSGVHSIGLLGKWKFIWSDAAYQDGLAIADLLRQQLS